MRLRPFRPADLDTLFEIDRECFPPGISYPREELRRFVEFRGGKTWIAEEGGEIAGFLIAHRQPGRVGHIVTIDVREQVRRRGVGRELMRAAEEWAHSNRLQLIYLETAEDNRAAQAFYEALGYDKVEKIPRYYSNGMAAWVMIKRLDRSPNP
jgi:ribosomal-protein-alanine N-acetyltransferase